MMESKEIVCKEDKCTGCYACYIRNYTIKTPINYDKISTEQKGGWILSIATKLLYLNSRIFNAPIGLKIRNVIPDIFFKVYRKVLLLCLENPRIK